MSQKVQVILEVTSRGMDAFGKVSGKLDRFQSKVSSVFNSIVNLPNIIAGTVGVAITKSFVNADMQLEALENRLSAAVGKFTDSAEELKYLRQEADRMGLKFIDLSKSYAGFSAATTRAGLTMQETRDIFRDISETAVSLKLAPERVKLTFMALEQMASKGVVSMEELRRQLGDSFPAAMEIGAKAMGMTNQAFNKFVASGKLMSSEFLPRFAKQVKEELGGSFETSAKQIQANLNRAGNSFYDFKQKIGEALNPIINEVIPMFIQMLNKINEHSDKTRIAINVLAVGVTALWNGFEIAADSIAAALMYIYRVGLLVFIQIFGWLNVAEESIYSVFKSLLTFGDLFAGIKEQLKTGGSLGEFLRSFDYKKFIEPFSSVKNAYGDLTANTQKQFDELIHIFKTSGSEFEKNIDDIANSMLAAEMRMAEKLDVSKNGVFEDIKKQDIEKDKGKSPLSLSTRVKYEKLMGIDIKQEAQIKDLHYTWAKSAITGINEAVSEEQTNLLNDTFLKLVSFDADLMTQEEVFLTRREMLWKSTQESINAGLKQSFMTLVQLDGTMKEKLLSIMNNFYNMAMGFLWDYLSEYISAKMYEQSVGVAVEKQKQTENISTAATAAVKTASEGAGSVANTPYIGPILALAAFASIMGVIMAAVNNAKNFYTGTSNAPAGWHWVGERGPELMRMRGGETILSNRDSMNAMSGGGVNISLTLNGPADRETVNYAVDRLKRISNDIKDAVRLKYLKPAQLW